MHRIPSDDLRPLRPSARVAPRVALVGLTLLPIAFEAQAAPGASEPWRTEVTADGSEPHPRHEAAGVAVDGRMYLLGGRSLGGPQRVDVYDPVADTWTDLGPMPAELHHFQPVVVGDEIWVLGALTGGYPRETPVADVHAFDTVSGEWRIAGQVPEARRRGSAAAARDDDHVYLLGGNTRGHDGGAVPWLDRLDPDTGVWTTLPDAPHARDHFGAAVIDGLLVAAGGRTSAYSATDSTAVFEGTVGATDVYSIADGAWREAADIPTERAGAFTVGHEAELIVIGGEVADDADALAVVEAFDVDGGAWRTLRPLKAGRHSGGAAVLDGRLHVVAGSPTRGGGNLADHESLGLDTDGAADDVDTDGDGLSDAAEAELGTDPAVADTDGDTLDDGAEVAGGTDPLLSDTDGDGLDDAAETAGPTDPALADTDAGGVNDGDELAAGTDPLDGDDDVPGGTTGGSGGGDGGDDGGDDGSGGSDGGADGAGGDEDPAPPRSGGGGGIGASGALGLMLAGLPLALRVRRRRHSRTGRR